MWQSADSVREYTANSLKRIEKEFGELKKMLHYGDTEQFPKLKLRLPKNSELKEKYVEDDYEPCGICHEPLSESPDGGDKVFFKMCRNKHEFHALCIKPWFKRGHKNCPTCQVYFRR
jgi:Zinc finger, C3HC4 type (RING finger)